MMQTYTLSQLTEETLNALPIKKSLLCKHRRDFFIGVTLKEQAGVSDRWHDMQILLTSEECMWLEKIKSTLRERQLVLMNEATLWARAIYPLLLLAEKDYIQAWAGVPLKATYPTFELEGEADGALAPSVGGRIQPPYLVVHEAKRGINAPKSKVQNGVAFGMREAQLHFGRLSHKPLRLVDITFPQFQLYGEMLAAAWLNWENNAEPEQEIFGCYTVNDSWAFVRGVVDQIESEKPTRRVSHCPTRQWILHSLNIEFAPVYNGVLQAEHIVQILKSIVAKHISN